MRAEKYYLRSEVTPAVPYRKSTAKVRRLFHPTKLFPDFFSDFMKKIDFFSKKQLSVSKK